MLLTTSYVWHSIVNRSNDESFSTNTDHIPPLVSSAPSPPRDIFITTPPHSMPPTPPNRYVRRSFAQHLAVSSPVSSHGTSPLPPSPPLHELINLQDVSFTSVSASTSGTSRISETSVIMALTQESHHSSFASTSRGEALSHTRKRRVSHDSAEFQTPKASQSNCPTINDGRSKRRKPSPDEDYGVQHQPNENEGHLDGSDAEPEDQQQHNFSPAHRPPLQLNRRSGALPLESILSANHYSAWQGQQRGTSENRSDSDTESES